MAGPVEEWRGWAGRGEAGRGEAWQGKHLCEAFNKGE